jgi:hypothetical protein
MIKVRHGLIRTLKQLQDMDLIDHEWICPSGPVDCSHLVITIPRAGIFCGF